VASSNDPLARIVTGILLRDAHRIFRLHHLVRMLAGILGLVVINLFAMYVLWNRPPLYRYVFTDANGQIVQLVPLDQPKQDDEYVKRWAVNAVIESYTFDFHNYKRQLSRAQEDLTVVGWREWQKALETSGNFRAVVANKYVSTAVPEPGTAVIEKKGDFNGRHAWRVRFRMLVYYESSQRRTNQALDVTVVVIRQPEYVNISGLGVRQILAKGGAT
jgi:intracellular multiplication protein IcmL